MCIGVPGKVLGIEGTMASVDVGGTVREIALDLVDGVSVGDYVIAHAGFAIHRVDEDEAKKTLAILKEITDSLAPGEGLCEF